MVGHSHIDQKEREERGANLCGGGRRSLIGILLCIEGGGEEEEAPPLLLEDVYRTELINLVEPPPSLSLVNLPITYRVFLWNCEKKVIIQDVEL